MQFSEQWLRSWVNPSLSTEELSHLLTMAGLEVEDVQAAAPAFTGVVVAEVMEVVPHENADRLRVTKVNVGTGELVQIVCGAPNVAVGLKVPCALSGAVLPGDFRIKPTKMRGVESNGMLCSGKELGVPDDVDGLLVLDPAAPVGTPIRDWLGLDDALFTLKITPNRADALSLRGIAREVAALTGTELAMPPIPAVVPGCDAVRGVRIDAPEACGRYAGRVVRGVNAAAPTPEWMRRRLERSGLRPVSALVDITNYVLLEQGQPMHAFDLDKVEGDIVARMAHEGETLLCLNGKTVDIAANTLVIADSQRVLALAGLMGGEESGVTTASRDVFLESAWFAPAMIAGKSRQYGFGSDSSYRYERGVDIALQRDALERATALVLEICGGEAGPVIEVAGKLPERAPVRVRGDRVRKLLGIDIGDDAIAAIFARLGFAFHRDGGLFDVMSPSFRHDIEIEEDLIEEVARVHGYDAIPSDNPAARLAMLPLPEERRPRAELRRIAAGRGYQEVVTYAFVDERWERELAGNAQPVRLINPMAVQMSVMRSSLIGGLLDVLVSNINRKQPRVRLFELARVFLRGEDGWVQPEKLSGLAWGARQAEQWAARSERVDFYDVKADVEALLAPRVATFRKAAHPALHPGRCAEILLDGEIVGVLGELHPKWVQEYDLPSAPVLFELDFALLETARRVTVRPVSKFQPVRRDLALLVRDEVAVADILHSFQSVAPAIVTEVAVFDVYRGKGVEEGCKSVAFRVQLQDPAKTLTDEEVESAVALLLKAAGEAHDARLRV